MTAATPEQVALALTWTQRWKIFSEWSQQGTKHMAGSGRNKPLQVLTRLSDILSNQPRAERQVPSLSLVCTLRFAWGKNFLVFLPRKLLGGSEFFITGCDKEMVCNLAAHRLHCWSGIPPPPLLDILMQWIREGPQASTFERRSGVSDLPKARQECIREPNYLMGDHSSLSPLPMLSLYECMSINLHLQGSKSEFYMGTNR